MNLFQRVLHCFLNKPDVPSSRQDSVHLRINSDQETIQFETKPCFQSRAQSAKKLAQQALGDCEFSRKGTLDVWLDDFPPCQPIVRQGGLRWTSSCGNALHAGRFFPCPYFDGWPELGIDSYDALCEKIAASGEQPVGYDRLLWIGNSRTSPRRSALLELGRRIPQAEFHDMDWREAEGDGRLHPTDYISLPDHARYRYLIDIEGRGYSARAKMLLFSGRPLFLVDRPHVEFWWSGISPWVHYIPVQRDLSDLASQISWANNNVAEAEAIGRNGKQFAFKHLRKESALKQIRRLASSAGLIR